MKTHWRDTLKKVLGWPSFLVGGFITLTGAVLLALDMVVLLPNWLWLGIGILLFFLSIGGMLFQFQRRLDYAVPERPPSPLPSKPRYSKGKGEEVKSVLGELIKRGESYQANWITPNKDFNYYTQKQLVDKWQADIDQTISNTLPEYIQYIGSFPEGITGAEYNKYQGVDMNEAQVRIRIDRLLFKLRGMFSQFTGD